MSRITYVLREAIANIGRNGFVVLGAVLAVFISLTLTFGTLVFGEVVRINTLQWAEDVRVLAFVDDKALPSVPEMQAEMEGWEEVESVFFLTKADSFDEARVLLSNQPATLRVIEASPDIVPASLRIKPVDPDDYRTIVMRLQTMGGVFRVQSAGQAIDAMISLRDGLQVMFWLLALALGVAAVALIANTIHMAIYARREEIEIMRLVGASSWYIRVPFLLEGAIEGFIGAALAVVSVVAAQQLAVDRLTDLPDWINVAVQRDYLLSQGALVLLFGVLAGLIGSSLSLTVHKYLRT